MVTHTEAPEEGRYSLIETLYGAEHLNISTSRGNKVDDDTGAGMARGNGSGNTDRRHVSSAATPQTYASYRCAYSSTAFGKSEHAIVSV
jgi:hypothetical protein